MSHYFESPTAPTAEAKVTLRVADRTIELRTAGGVFSPAHIDPGTRVLLDVAPAPPAVGNILDLGCGYGPIALTLGYRAPDAAVWAVDVNERALELCARNASAAGLTNVKVCAPGEVPAGTTFAAIYSNPPIRIGKPALHDLLKLWLRRLDRGAHAYLVVQRNLGSDSLQRWLTEAGWPTERIASRRGFRVLRCDA